MDNFKILKQNKRLKINLGLERVEKALKIFNHPENSVDFIHIAGTNGKGSICAVLETVLLEWGKKRIGKYTSPHLFSYTERFSVNGKNISEYELDKLIQEVILIDKKENLELTEFEILTVVCFLYFREHNVETGILETGLGGRLDATNVIKNPVVSIISSISYDHKECLGDTIEKIAKEKAEIIKPNSKCAFLKENSGYSVLLDKAIKCGAEILPDDIDVSVSDGFCYINGDKIPFSLNGEFQAENLKLALIVLKYLNVPYSVIKKALPKVKWIFRMQNIDFKGHNLLVDSCHNPDGARVLNEYIKKYHQNKKIKFIFGCLKNKDYKTMLDILYDKNYDFYFYKFDYPNSLDFEYVKNYNIKETKDPMFEIKKNDYDLCIIAGSIYMLGLIFKKERESFQD